LHAKQVSAEVWAGCGEVDVFEAISGHPRIGALGLQAKWFVFK
jgi:hypothetical protein